MCFCESSVIEFSRKKKKITTIFLPIAFLSNILLDIRFIEIKITENRDSSINAQCELTLCPMRGGYVLQSPYNCILSFYTCVQLCTNDFQIEKNRCEFFMRFGTPKETLFKTMDSNFQESINIQDNNKYLNIHSRYIEN